MRLEACERASSDLQSALLKANARMDAHAAVPQGPLDLSNEMQRMTAASATQEGRLSELEHLTRSLSRTVETQERRPYVKSDVPVVVLSRRRSSSPWMREPPKRKGPRNRKSISPPACSQDRVPL